MVKTRFAPSPSGNLHIGGARTAIFNFLFAKKYNGSFVLRIEDSNRDKSTIESVDNIINSLKWLGIKWDEGVGVSADESKYFQSYKLNYYRDIAESLVKSGKAYYCFCSKDDLDELKKHNILFKKDQIYNKKCLKLTEEEIRNNLYKKSYVIRIKSGNNKIIVKDKIKGNVIFDSKKIGDFIILRSNGYPTYNFACTLDDIAMKITHVIRGDEHLCNTPKQIIIYNALKKKIPKFIHTPVILDSKTGKKMSKRANGSSIYELINKGYNGFEVFLYIASLGCNIGKMKKFDLNEIVNKFNISKIKQQPEKASIKKLNKIRKRLNINANKMWD